jgi:FKBP-type peptidyl-prolyl cis-trans isomerase 2
MAFDRTVKHQITRKLKSMKTALKLFALVWLSWGVSCITGSETLAEPAGIERGDQATIRFTCRFPNGEMAVSSDEDATNDASPKKSPVFMPRGAYAPFRITAGQDAPALGPEGKRGFEGEVAAAIAEAVIGMRAGESRLISVSPRPEQMLPDSEVLPVSKIWKRPKQITLTPEAYRYQTGQEPKIGQPYNDGELSGKVDAVMPSEVRIVFSVASGTVIHTDFGEATVRETERGFEIHLAPQVGRLVRSGALVGRITREDGSMFFVDFRHPFGGEMLECQVLVESVEP